jgi:protein tyrosine phosphatase (PTP) superfamily phosphohydrolase (DUF442 family)
MALKGLALAVALFATILRVHAAELEAPNVVPINERLVTAGQPTAKALAALAQQGFEAVIYLAPPTVSDAVKDEAKIVEAQGLAFVNIPIVFSNPTEADYRRFVQAMKQLSGKKVLVHCQVNLRASSLVFLWRVLEGGDKADEAYRSVSRVWTPQGPWKGLIESQLKRGGVDFEIW